MGMSGEANLGLSNSLPSWVPLIHFTDGISIELASAGVMVICLAERRWMGRRGASFRKEHIFDQLQVTTTVCVGVQTCCYIRVRQSVVGQRDAP